MTTRVCQRCGLTPESAEFYGEGCRGEPGPDGYPVPVDGDHVFVIVEQAAPQFANIFDLMEEVRQKEDEERAARYMQILDEADAKALRIVMERAS